MKQLSYLSLGVVSIFFLAFFVSSDLKNFVSNQIAGVIGIEKEVCPSGRGSIFEDEIMVHVNKEKSLPKDYIPKELVNAFSQVKITKSVCVKKEVLLSLKEMFEDAEKENIILAVTSGFRSRETQSWIYKNWIRINEGKTEDRVAKPLHSEHQLGTTIDLTGKSISYISAADKFDGTKEDLWLKENAYKYGFVLSYPKGRTEITGYDYEPWHYRYVGKDNAKEIFEQNISVEEYFNSFLNTQKL